MRQIKNREIYMEPDRKLIITQHFCIVKTCYVFNKASMICVKKLQETKCGVYAKNSQP